MRSENGERLPSPERRKGQRLEFEQTDLSVDDSTHQDSCEYHDFWGWGRRYAQRLLSNEFDSEDVVQEAFCRLLAKRQNGDWNPPKTELAAIFARIIRNLSIDKLRRTKPITVQEAELCISHEPTPESQAIAKETRQQLQAALTGLSDRWREALMLRASGLNYEEISQVMNVTKAQVRTWIFRARQRLIDDLNLEDAT